MQQRQHTETLLAPDWVERNAKLFEAGEYPDKGVTVTQEDLEGLAAGFSEPVPVLIEHAESPLEIGYLQSVRAMGSELFGVLRLSPEANALVERSGARSLSLGLAPDLSGIREVSLVREPRIATATMYSALHFDGRLEDAELSGAQLDAQARQTFVAAETHEALRSRYARLLSDREEAQAQARVKEMIAQGRLTPAQAELARTLLLSKGLVAFGGRRTEVSALFESFLDLQPAMSLFSEVSPSPEATDSSHLLMPEEAQFYRRHFPDVSLDEIARRRTGA